MQTQYGKLPIAIDPATGRAKVVRGGVGAPGKEAAEYQVGSRVKSGRADGLPSSPPARNRPGVPVTRRPQRSRVGNPVPSSSDEYDSKLEAARGTYLGYLLLAKDIQKVVHHPFQIDIGGRLYTPDYLVWWADGRITIEEVKGSLKSKNARDSITRLHVAAALFPMFTWYLILRVGRTRWTERLIRPEDTHAA